MRGKRMAQHMRCDDLGRSSRCAASRPIYVSRLKSVTPPQLQSEQFAHPKRRTVVFFALLPLIGIALSYVVDRWVWPRLMAWAVDSALSTPEKGTRIAVLIALAIAVLVAFCIGLTAWFWVVSARIYRSAVFPPRGYPLLVKTAILRGASANRQARLHFLCGLFCAAVGGYVVWSLFTISPIAATLRAAGG